MAQTTFGTAMSSQLGTIPAIPRDDDPTTCAIRGDPDVSLDEIATLTRTHPPSTSVASSSAIPSESAFTSHKHSNSTKPTSDGTSYPIGGYNGKGKSITKYASSVSATQGSGSDTEREATQDFDVTAIGGWAGPPVQQERSPKENRRPKHKKPVVIIQKEGRGSDTDQSPAIKQINRRIGKDPKYLRQRPQRGVRDQLLNFAEEGRLSEASTISSPPPLSRRRRYFVSSLIAAVILTLAVAVWAATYTGKSRMRCTEGIVFAATVAIALLTAIAMITARCTLSDASRLATIELIVGFTLLFKVHDFM